MGSFERGRANALNAAGRRKGILPGWAVRFFGLGDKPAPEPVETKLTDADAAKVVRVTLLAPDNPDNPKFGQKCHLLCHSEETLLGEVSEKEQETALTLARKAFGDEDRRYRHTGTKLLKLVVMVGVTKGGGVFLLGEPVREVSLVHGGKPLKKLSAVKAA